MHCCRLVCAVVLAGLAACESLYDDTGSAAPGSPWPWVCADGGLAPDSGCLGESADGQASDSEAGAPPSP
jgi:hypothetical protein